MRRTVREKFRDFALHSGTFGADSFRYCGVRACQQSAISAHFIGISVCSPCALKFRGAVRRIALRRAAVRCLGDQHHARSRQRHRKLERRGDQDGVAGGQAARGPPACGGDAERLLQDSDPARSRRHRRLSALAAAGEPLPAPVYKMQVPHQVFPGAEKPMSESDLDDKVKRGFYLVTIAHCMECHTPFGPPATGVDFNNSLGKGGREFRGPWGVSTSRNITSSKSAGIGDWSDADVKRAITQGVRKDGTKLKPPMGYPFYAKMTNGDLDAMVAYLRTVPPKE